MQDHTFVHEGRKYQVMLPSLKFSGCNYTAEQIVASPEIQGLLLEHAWNGRDESSFAKNGIFKIVYEENAATTTPADELTNTGEETATDSSDGADNGEEATDNTEGTDNGEVDTADATDNADTGTNNADGTAETQTNTAATEVTAETKEGKKERKK